LIAAFGCATAWPLAARVQQSAVPVIGFLNSASAGPYRQLVDAFRRLTRPASSRAEM